MKTAPMNLLHKMLISFAFCSSSLAVPALAVEQLVIVNPQVRVFTSPSMSSPVITLLKKGQVVSAGVNPGGGFKKVLIQDATGKKIIGYVALVDLSPPLFGDKNKKKEVKGKGVHGSGFGLRRHYAVGANLGFNYQYQSSRTITDSIGDSVSESGLSGTNLIMGLLFYVPISPKLSLQADFNYKPSGLTGTGTVAGATQTSTIVDHQNFYALGVTGKFYSDENSDWWYGPGVEYDMGTSGSLQLGAKPTYTFTSADLNNFIMVFASTGYDFSSSKNFYFTPSFRLGAIVNGSPIIYEFDMVVSGSYRF